MEYLNLQDAGAMLKKYGKLLKTIGLAALALGLFLCIKGLRANGFESISDLLGGIVTLFGGAGLHVSGTFIAASGESMDALRDIAINSKKS